ncbi:MAG: hypothetical protein KJ614_11175 [Gammaproteobacteria bacterium]|uniref:HVO_A0114 family putative DNA-binding protein n=1 Tax=Rhodoferax sp. TaxID=50421 RepID=UPI001826D504|nr:hypothetical protein [Rhodoferax sp.]MBU3899470.1 hypothetical protein [Gammaproteobacteria bacterium]MBA3059540.1 hypothetical protein [Rhodoferax sp.]MBU3998717.1 hypothetical protein [Gammaproteobacteria bacterium]MBU4017946.1 hypothetical protein [Gammaproteobacteria bacterium]MBU4080364.1 hypothetical protein [Gammaproteobacteria bacterium]
MDKITGSLLDHSLPIRFIAKMATGISCPLECGPKFTRKILALDDPGACQSGCLAINRIGKDHSYLTWPKRWELLRTSAGAGAVSIGKTARRVGRDVKAVHGDLQAMSGCGLLVKTEDGIAFRYDAVHLDFMLKAV